MSLWREVRLVAGKDLRIEARSKVTLQQIVPFGMIVLLLFAFALDPDRGILRRVAPGLFWVTVLLAALLAVSRSFGIEADNGARDGLRLSGLDGPALFLGKAAALAVELLALEVVLTTTVVLVYGIHLDALVPLTAGDDRRDRRRGGHRYPLRRARRRAAGARDARPGAAAPRGGAGAARGHPSLGSGHRRHTFGCVAVGGTPRGLRPPVHRDRDAGLRPAPGGSMTEQAPSTRDDTRLLKPVVSTVLGWASLVAVVVLTLFGLWGAPADAVQSDAQRLMYIHVPAAWIVYLAFGVTALGSALWLWPRTPCPGVGPRRRRVGRDRGDLHRAHPRPRFAVGPAGLGHLVGVGRARSSPPRCCSSSTSATSRLRHIPASPDARAKRCSIAALIAFVDVPIVHFSVNWWRTLHQQGTVFNEELDAKIHGVMAFTLWFGVLAFTLVYVYLLDRRYRLLALDEDREDREVELAIAERVAAERTGDSVDLATTTIGFGAAPVGGAHREPEFEPRARHGVRRVRDHRLGAHRCGARWLLALDRPAHQACGEDPGRASDRRPVPPGRGRAPPPRPARPKRKGRYIVAIGGCVVAVVAIIVLAVALSENVVYFRTVTEAVHNRKSEGTVALPARRWCRRRHDRGERQAGARSPSR